jgi:hypothetical protein
MRIKPPSSLGVALRVADPDSLCDGVSLAVALAVDVVLCVGVRLGVRVADDERVGERVAVAVVVDECVRLGDRDGVRDAVAVLVRDRVGVMLIVDESDMVGVRETVGDNETDAVGDFDGDTEGSCVRLGDRLAEFVVEIVGVSLAVKESDWLADDDAVCVGDVP